MDVYGANGLFSLGMHSNRDGTYSIDVYNTGDSGSTGGHLTYSTNDFEQTKDKKISWEGREASNGAWMVAKTVTQSETPSTDSTSIRYATALNNPTITDYSTAWNSRKFVLVYGTYFQAFALT